MSNVDVEEEEDDVETSHLRSLVKNRRFDDHTLRILKSLVRSKCTALIVFLRSESIRVMHHMASHPDDIHLKLSILDFFVRAFALCGDIQSCLAFRYEAFLLRDLNSATHPSLHVSSTEWSTLAQQCLDNGFPSISIKACEYGLRYKDDEEVDAPQPRLKRLKEIALASAPATSYSVQAQTAEYTRMKRTIQNSRDHSSLEQKQTDTPILASNLFRNGIKKQNERTLHRYQHRPRQAPF